MRKLPKQKPLKHRGTEEAEEIGKRQCLSRTNADQEIAKTGKGKCLPLINTDDTDLRE
jgi:hypothetical protein